MTKNTNQSFIQTLWERKVPQYLGTYFAVGFGLLQFVEFLTKRYDLNGKLVDKYLLVWLALVPAIFIISYFGAQLKFKATNLKWPKVLVIGNVIVAFLLGSLLFNNDAAESTVVELIDEEGKTATAIVPKLNKVKTVASFQFENLTQDPENDWYGIAFSQLLQLNLVQRPEFYSVSAYTLNYYHDALGLPSFVTPNLGMQREIARKSRNDYFTSISYTIEDNTFEFKGHLYSSKDGKSILDLIAKNTDPYAAMDTLKEQIFDNIPNAIQSDKNQMYMPASALITDNIEALKYHTQSRFTFYKDPSALEETLKLEKQAVALAPTCSECHYYVGDVLYGLGRKDEAIVSLKRAIQYGKALPERLQFKAKETLYGVTNNLDAFYKLQEVRKKMFPYEFQPYSNLLSLYQADYGIDRAKALLQEAIDNGNAEKGLLALSDLQLENEEYVEALKTLERFSAEFPDRDQDRLKYAAIYEKQGKIDAAKEVLLEEEALDPLNSSIQLRLALFDYRSQDVSSAYKRIDQGIKQATSLTDSLSYFWTKSDLLRNSGQIKAAFKSIQAYEKHAVKRAPINRIIASTFQRKAYMHQSIGEFKPTEKLLAKLVKFAPQDEEVYGCALYTNAIQNDYAVTAEMIKDKISCRSEYEKFGKGYGSYFDIIMGYHAKDYDSCIKLLESDNGKLEKIVSDKYFLSNVYAKSGNLEKAKLVMKKEIDQKTNEPKYYYQMASLLEAENPKEARKYLDIALLYWDNADANYIYFQRANTLSKRLGAYDDSIKL